jgi:hypothetical protein
MPQKLVQGHNAGLKAPDKAGANQTIYGAKIAPLLRVKTATTKATISADTTFESFIATPYRCAEIVSVQNCTIPSRCGFRYTSCQLGRLTGS